MVTVISQNELIVKKNVLKFNITVPNILTTIVNAYSKFNYNIYNIGN